MSRRLTLPLAVLALGGGGFAIATTVMRDEPTTNPKVDGEVYVLGDEFVVNLEDGYGKVTVALLLRHGTLEALGGEQEGGTSPSEGYGPLPQEAIVRDIVTDTLTGSLGRQLRARVGRNTIKAQILRRIRRRSDVPVVGLYFTDLTVQ